MKCLFGKVWVYVQGDLVVYLKKKHLPDLVYIDNFEIKVKLIKKFAELQIAEARMVIQ
jgi:hypothetical protein